MFNLNRKKTTQYVKENVCSINKSRYVFKVHKMQTVFYLAHCHEINAIIKDIEDVFLLYATKGLVIKYTNTIRN